MAIPEKCLSCEQALSAATKQASCIFQGSVDCFGGEGSIEDELVIKGWAKRVSSCQQQGCQCPDDVRQALTWLLEPEKVSNKS